MSPIVGELISARECEDFCANISRQEANWHPVRKNGFFTLGRPLYQMYPDIVSYHTENAHWNPILYATFRTLYERSAAFLCRLFNEPVAFLAGAALPGFHIFDFNAPESSPYGGPHFDLSHRNFESFYQQDFSQSIHLSYTVALQLPCFSSGIDIYPVTFDQGCNKPAQELADESTPSFFPYTAGNIYCFSGYQLHRISCVANPVLAGRRITFQGHVFRFKNRLVSYW